MRKRFVSELLWSCTAGLALSGEQVAALKRTDLSVRVSVQTDPKRERLLATWFSHGRRYSAPLLLTSRQYRKVAELSHGAKVYLEGDRPYRKGRYIKVDVKVVRWVRTGKGHYLRWRAKRGERDVT